MTQPIQLSSRAVWCYPSISCDVTRCNTTPEVRSPPPLPPQSNSTHVSYFNCCGCTNTLARLGWKFICRSYFCVNWNRPKGLDPPGLLYQQCQLGVKTIFLLSWIGKLQLFQCYLISSATSLYCFNWKRTSSLFKLLLLFLFQIILSDD